MVCPVCPTAGWFGGFLGSYLGVNPPPHTKGRMISAFITANLICITVIALKKIFTISLCVGGDFTLANFIRVMIKTLLMGIIYSIAVNYLLNKYVFYQNTQELLASVVATKKEEEKSCCSHLENQDFL